MNKQAGFIQCDTAPQRKEQIGDSASVEEAAQRRAEQRSQTQMRSSAWFRLYGVSL